VRQDAWKELMVHPIAYKEMRLKRRLALHHLKEGRNRGFRLGVDLKGQLQGSCKKTPKTEMNEKRKHFWRPPHRKIDCNVIK